MHGADPSGRLTIPLPPPGHALLLTKSLPHTTLISKDAHLLSPSAKLNARPLRGIGALTDSSGNTHWFSTIPFDVPANSLGRQPVAPRVVGSHIPPRDVDAKLFSSRPLTLLSPENNVYHTKDKVNLAHISQLPLTGPRQGELKIYPQELMEEVLKGPQAEVRPGRENWVQWAERPNWSSAERKMIAKERKQKEKERALVMRGWNRQDSGGSGSGSGGEGSSPRKWLGKLKDRFSTSRSGSRLNRGNGRGGDEGTSSGGGTFGPV